MPEKLKMLQICAVGFTVEKLLLPLIDEMSGIYDVTIICSYDNVTDKLRDKGYHIENINIDRKISPFGNLKSIFKLYLYIKKEKIKIVHVHTPIAGILGRIAAKLAHVPIVIYTAHGFYFHDNMTRFKKSLFLYVEKLGGRLCDYIFTQSTEDYYTAVNKGIISKDKIAVIGNGINIGKFNIDTIGDKLPLIIRREFGIKDGDILIGIVGRVVREKGYIEWVEAARKVLKKYDNVIFIAVGDTLPSDRDGIKSVLDRLTEDYGIGGKVIFTGSRLDIPELLSAMDIFTLPSYREGMPRSLIEAMSMSKPAIATNIRGCREEVVEGETGYLIPVNDSESLAEKLIYLIEHPELRTTMGEAARKKVEREFDERRVLGRQLEIISKLVLEKEL
jgi:glycosyltransferase involved in cell wall biosynthesis